MPEWYLVIGLLAVISALGVLWTPLLFTLPVLVLALAAPLVQAILSSAHASFSDKSRTGIQRLRPRTVTVILHILQPLARLQGRLQYGLSPWRRRGKTGFLVPRLRTYAFWSEHWQSAHQRLESLETALRSVGNVVLKGGHYDRWDLEVRGGMLGSVRLLMAIEEHGAGKQLLRLRSWPRCSGLGIALPVLFTALCIGAALDQAWVACGALGIIALTVVSCVLHECGIAAFACGKTLGCLQQGQDNG
jgi:hypothetical protein